MQRGSKYSAIKTITKHESAYKAFPCSPCLASEWLIYKPAVNTEQLLTSFYRKAKKVLPKKKKTKQKKTCSTEYYAKLLFSTWQSEVYVHHWPVKERCLFSFQISTQALGAAKQIARDHPKVSTTPKQQPAYPYSWQPASPPSICNCALTCVNTKQDPTGSMHPKH